MEKRMMNKRLTHAIDTCMSGIQIDPFLCRKIVRNETRSKNRKMPLATITAIILIAVVSIALAVSILDIIKPVMDQNAQVIINGDWTFEDKTKVISALVEIGIVDVNNEDYLACVNEILSIEERNMAANRLLDSMWGDAIRENNEKSVLQQEEYFSPDLETVFSTIYRHTYPEATDEEIENSYNRWFEESELFMKPGKEEFSTHDQATSEEDIMQLCLEDLSEVYNFNQKERDATKITISWDNEHFVWVVHLEIAGSILRDSLKKEWINNYYDVETNMYSWNQIYAANGSCISESDYSEYEWNNLIPKEAYPNWEKWRDAIKCFLNATIEEQEEFSIHYKPVIDKYLKQHPDIEMYFSSVKSGDADKYDPIPFLITRHSYGHPSDRDISEKQAIDIAKEAYINSGLQGVNQELIETRCLIHSLFILNAQDDSIWKITIEVNRAENLQQEGDHMNGYRVLIDATTGIILNEEEAYITDYKSVREMAEIVY